VCMLQLSHVRQVDGGHSGVHDAPVTETGRGGSCPSWSSFLTRSTREAYCCPNSAWLRVEPSQGVRAYALPVLRYPVGGPLTREAQADGSLFVARPRQLPPSGTGPR